MQYLRTKVMRYLYSNTEKYYNKYCNNIKTATSLPLDTDMYITCLSQTFSNIEKSAANV